MATLSSGYATTEPIAIANTGIWVFVAPENPAIMLSGARVMNPLSSDIEESTGIFKPLGNTGKIVVANSMYGVDGTYELVATGETEWTPLLALISYQGTLYVQDPLGRQKYVRFTTRNITETGKLTNLVRRVKVAYVEVGAP